MSKYFALFLTTCAAAAAVDISTDVNDVKFYYYSTVGDRREIAYNDVSTLNSLKSGAPTMILIDGFLSDSTSPMPQNTKNSALTKGTGQQNVIVVDWGRLSGAGATLKNLFETAAAYSKALNNVGPVGGRVADFINFLKQGKNINPLNIHIIGHSLGAHIAGAAGTYFQQRHGGVLGRISGLDPAGPFFSTQLDADKRLDRGDAVFVDIYHTNRGTLGDSDHQTGSINVYVNGGDNQPGCEEADSSGFAGFCSHSYSWKLYDATFHQDILACPCVGLPCQCSSNCNTQCSNPIVIGVRTPISATGAYRLIITDPLN